MGFETNDLKINGETVMGGDNKKPVNVTLDGDYIATTSHPSWALLNFRTVIGKMSSYFKGGTTLWAIISASVKTGSGTGRFYFRDDINNSDYGLWDMDIVDITWQNNSIIRLAFAGSTDLSKIFVGETYRIDGAANSSNNGQHEIKVVNDGSDYIDIEIPARTDGVDDETDTDATGETGSVTQFTNSTAQVITSNPFQITEETFGRLRLNKSAGSGSTINSYELILFTKE